MKARQACEAHYREMKAEQPKPSEPDPRNPPLFDFLRLGEMAKGSSITLRDWFAGQALAGLACAPDEDNPALWAYTIADDMLDERMKLMESEAKTSKIEDGANG